jgi:hypothetical protein
MIYFLSCFVYIVFCLKMFDMTHLEGFECVHCAAATGMQVTLNQTVAIAIVYQV